jgi:superfamily I DNA/RNA helicase
VDDVKEDFERPSVQKVNVNDFTSALEVDDSRSRFYVVDNEKELTSILNAPLSQWRIFLHPKQRKLATSDFNGPARILGGAGTGKTVLAMHRARWLAETRTSEGDKILFTTFSRNLAGDIHSNLETLCTKETLAKIEVINLDRWVHGYLQKHRYPHRICYSFDEDEVKRAWGRSYGIKSDAVDLDEGFYKLEWEQVIAAQGITTLDEYRMARRQGRGTLRRPARDAVWPVFEEFRAQLTSRKLKMVDDAYRDAAALLKSDDSCQKYTSIIVDETQDFGPMALRLIRSLVKEGRNDLFFVGDGHQRIYNRNRAAMSKCGINIVGRSKKLHLNYRTTEEIRSYATSLLEGVSVDDLDDGVDTNKGYISLSHGAAPNVQHVESVDDALNRAVQIATKQSDISKTHCIIAPSNLLCDQLKQMLERTNIEAMIVTPDGRDKSESLAVRISTMHRAKGLEFDKVTVMAKKSVLELPVQDETERKLVYVSLTRAKREAALIVY